MFISSFNIFIYEKRQRTLLVIIMYMLLKVISLS